MRTVSSPAEAIAANARSNAAGPTRHGQSGPSTGTKWAPTGTIDRPSRWR